MSLKIYYSGAKSPNGINTDPSKSLGQYPSIIEVPDNLLGNLFDSLSRYTINQNKPEVRAIVLSNEGSAPLVSPKIWVRYSDDSDSEDGVIDDCEFSLGYASLIPDSCGDPIFPYSVTNQNASPYQVTFVEADSDVNFLTLPTIAPGIMIGLWIKRKISAAAQQPKTNEELLEILKGTVVLPTQENVELNISWD